MVRWLNKIVAVGVFGPRVTASRSTRIGWATISGVSLSVLIVACYLKPDPTGMGTHQGLGMPPCSFVLTSGLPCPTCGMTTAFSCVVRGRLWDAFLAQPAGMAFCIATIGLLIYGVHVAIVGKTRTVLWDRFATRLMLGLGLLILGGWGFKMAHGLLTGRLPV